MNSKLVGRGPVNRVVRHDWQHALEAPTATRTHGATPNAAVRYLHTSTSKRLVAGSCRTAEWRAQYRRLMTSLCMHRPCVLRCHRPGVFSSGWMLLARNSESLQSLPKPEAATANDPPPRRLACPKPRFAHSRTVQCSSDRRGFIARRSFRERDSRLCLFQFIPPLLVVFR